VYRSKYGELHRTIGATLHNIGIVFLRSQKYEEALESFARAVRVRRGSIGRDHADVAISLVKVGMSQLLLHKFDDALLTFREALSVRRHSMGQLHPSTARIYNNIGCVHVERSEMREARRAFEAALDIQRNALCFDLNDENILLATATTLCNLGHLYSYRSMHCKASLVIDEAVEFQERAVGKSHPTVLSTMDSLADSYSKGGDYSEALRCYKEIVNRLENRETDGNDITTKNQRALAITYYKMSRIVRKQNDIDSAFRMLTESLCYVHVVGSPELTTRIKEEMGKVKELLQKTNLDWV